MLHPQDARKRTLVVEVEQAPRQTASVGGIGERQIDLFRLHAFRVPQGVGAHHAGEGPDAQQLDVGPQNPERAP